MFDNYSGPRPNPGDQRVIRRFLFLPKCIKGEWRWLSFSWIEQAFVKSVWGLDHMTAWEDRNWVNK